MGELSIQMPSAPPFYSWDPVPSLLNLLGFDNGASGTYVEAVNERRQAYGLLSNRSTDPMYSINELPDEIISDIFHFLIGDDKSLIAATSVCHLWRSIALERSTLWSNIYFWCNNEPLGPYKDPQLACEKVRMFLQRSGSCRLSLGISISHNFYDAEDLLNIVSPHLDRCERIVVRLDGPTHSLKLLPFPGTLSSLKVLDCDLIFPFSNVTLLTPQARCPLEVFISTSLGGRGPQITIGDLLSHLDPNHLRVLILCNEWLERMDWVAALRYTELESLEVGCVGETLLWSIEEDSDLPAIRFKQLHKLTLHGKVSGCLVPPMIQAESLRHLCIDVDAVGAMSYWEQNPWDTRPCFPNLRSCIIRAQWGFPIEPLALFIKSHHRHLIAVEIPLCYFGIIHSIQIPNDEKETTTTNKSTPSPSPSPSPTLTPPPAAPHPFKLLRLRIKQFDMLYVSDELAADIANDIEYVCKQRAKWGFRLEFLCSRDWQPSGPVAHMLLLRDRIPGFWIIACDEEGTGIPAEESWNRALLDGGEKE